MEVKLTSDISGTRNGVPWPPIGEVVNLPDEEAESLIRSDQGVKGDQPHEYADGVRAARLAQRSDPDSRASKKVAEADLKVHEAQAALSQAKVEESQGRMPEGKIPAPVVVDMTADHPAGSAQPVKTRR